jgi:uncharacterized membrane protein YsdA (DUF1294 family)
MGLSLDRIVGWKKTKKSMFHIILSFIQCFQLGYRRTAIFVSRGAIHRRHKTQKSKCFVCIYVRKKGCE